MARKNKQKPVEGGYKQGGDLVNQHKRFAMGENPPQGTPAKKKK